MPEDHNRTPDWEWLWRLFGLDPHRDSEADRLAEAERHWRDWKPGQSVANAIEQSEQPAEAIVMSEGGALPRTWKEAIPYVVWVVIILGFGLEFVAAIVHFEWLRASVSFAGLLITMTIALHWRHWTRRTNPNFVYPALLVLLFGLILSPFIEQRRWPFSYPADPAIYTENDALKSELGREKELATKWRFSSGLRQGNQNCQYQLEWSQKANSVATFWRELFVATGWTGTGKPTTSPTQSGITIRSKDTLASTQCAELVQRELSEFYPNPPSKIVPHQQTEFLTSCIRDACVQIEIDY